MCVVVVVERVGKGGEIEREYLLGGSAAGGGWICVCLSGRRGC